MPSIGGGWQDWPLDSKSIFERGDTRINADFFAVEW